MPITSSLLSPIDRETRVAGLDDERDEAIGRFVDVDDVHLRARHHDVARLQFGDLQYAFDHGQGIGIEQVALEGGMQQGHQLLAIAGLAHEQRAQAIEKGMAVRFVHGLQEGVCDMRRVLCHAVVLR
jgi:hypothetical protein